MQALEARFTLRRRKTRHAIRRQPVGWGGPIRPSASARCLEPRYRRSEAVLAHQTGWGARDSGTVRKRSNGPSSLLRVSTTMDVTQWGFARFFARALWPSALPYRTPSTQARSCRVATTLEPTRASTNDLSAPTLPRAHRTHSVGPPQVRAGAHAGGRISDEEAHVPAGCRAVRLVRRRVANTALTGPPGVAAEIHPGRLTARMRRARLAPLHQRDYANGQRTPTPRRSTRHGHHACPSQRRHHEPHHLSLPARQRPREKPQVPSAERNRVRQRQRGRQRPPARGRRRSISPGAGP